MSKAEEKARERRAELIKIIGDMGNNSSDAQVRSRLHALRNQLADSIGNSQTAEACDTEIYKILKKASGYQRDDLPETCLFALGRVRQLIEQRDAPMFAEKPSGGLRNLFRKKTNDTDNNHAGLYFEYQLNLIAQKEKQKRCLEQYDKKYARAVELMRGQSAGLAAETEKKQLLTELKSLEREKNTYDSSIAQMQKQIEHYRTLLTAQETSQMLTLLSDTPLVTAEELTQVMDTVELKHAEISMNNEELDSAVAEFDAMMKADATESQEMSELEMQLRADADLLNAKEEAEAEKKRVISEDDAKAQLDQILKDPE